MIWCGVIWHEDMTCICLLGRRRDGAADGESGSERAEVEGRKREWKGGSGWAKVGVEGRKWMGEAGVEGRRWEWKGRSRRAEAGVDGQKWMGGGGSGRAEVEGRRREWKGRREREEEGTAIGVSVSPCLFDHVRSIAAASTHIIIDRISVHKIVWSKAASEEAFLPRLVFFTFVGEVPRELVGHIVCCPVLVCSNVHCARLERIGELWHRSDGKGRVRGTGTS